MLDFDLAQLYEVETKNLNLAVKRNSTRFPDDFMFRLTKAEWKILRLQIETSNNAKPQRLQIETFGLWRGKYSKYPPNAFTEQGVSMLSSVLRSDKAIKIEQKDRKRIGYK